jgi:hypothetical protein
MQKVHLKRYFFSSMNLEITFTTQESSSNKENIETSGFVEKNLAQ